MGRTRTGPTPRETKFLELYLQTGDATQAAREAGYSHKSASAMGCQLKRKLAKEIDERVTQNFRGKSPRMAKIVEDLAETSRSDQVKLHAARDYLDRGGFKPVDRYEHVETELSREKVLDDLANVLSDFMPEVWPRMSDQEREKCLRIIGIDPALIKKDQPKPRLAVVESE